MSVSLLPHHITNMQNEATPVNDLGLETSESPDQKETPRSADAEVAAFATELFSARFAERNKTPQEIEELVDSFHERLLEQAGIERKISAITGTTAEYNERKLPYRFRLGIKTFLETYIDFVKEKLKGDLPTRERTKGLIREIDNSLFSSHPNLASYCGDYKDMLEVAAKTLDAPELQGTLASHIIGELNYNLSFDSKAEEKIEEMLANCSNLEAMRLISILESVANEAAANGKWADRGFSSITAAIEKQKQHSSPLVVLYSSAMSKRLREEAEDPSLGVVRYRDDPNYARLSRDMTKREVQEHRELTKSLTLEKELSRGGRLQYIAKDAIAITDQGLIPHEVALIDRKEILNTSREKDSVPIPAQFIDLADVYKDGRINPFNLKEEGDTKLLIQRFHDPFMRQEIKNTLGVSLIDISFESQLYLLRFMADADRPTFARLEAITHRIPNQAITFLESFLALRTGDEFAESLLTIGEKLRPKEINGILYSLERIYKSGVEFKNFFGQIEPELGRGVYLALVKRTTELLLVIQEVIQKGKAETQLYNGEKIAATDIKSVCQALTSLEYSITTIAEALRQSAEAPRSTEAPSQTHETVHAIRFETPKVLLQVREQGAKIGAHDATREFDGEARINFLVNIKTDEPIPEELSQPLRQQALSIRLDREGTVWIPGASVAIPESDPTRQQGSLSLDIGSIYGEPDNPNVEIGRLLAIGNALIAEKRGEKANFNHVREVFDPKFGDAEVFADVVRKLGSNLAGEQ